jgi:hypothetical protein
MLMPTIATYATSLSCKIMWLMRNNTTLSTSYKSASYTVTRAQQKQMLTHVATTSAMVRERCGNYMLPA